MDNFQRWKMHVESLMKQPNKDFQQRQIIEENIQQVEKKITSLQVIVQDYRDLLINANVFYKLYEEVELWLNEKTQQIKHINTTISEFKTGLKNNVKEIELVLNQIDENIEDNQKFNNSKIKKLSEISVKIQSNQ
jgi:succinate dehydrogenase/fumarate reductase-like Fe-S protein